MCRTRRLIWPWPFPASSRVCACLTAARRQAGRALPPRCRCRTAARCIPAISTRHRLDLIERGAERLGISILETHLQDASQPVPAWRGAMDVVLADVPCSGLGVIRKKPDIRYHEPSAELPALQRAILAQQAEYVRPGGVLLYSTCTILRRENEAVAEDFLRTHPDFVPENAPWPEGSGIAPGAMVTLLPGQHETDGFFICKFRRKP